MVTSHNYTSSYAHSVVILLLCCSPLSTAWVGTTSTQPNAALRSTNAPLEESCCSLPGTPTKDNLFPSRRTWLQESAEKLSFMTSGAALVTFPFISPAKAADAVEETNADNNEFIARLKAQSQANKDQYKQQSMRADKLSPSQFDGQYERPKYVGVFRSDQSVQMVTKDELAALLGSGEVEETYKLVLNERTGEMVFDYAKGKIYVFADKIESPLAKEEEGILTAKEEEKIVAAKEEEKIVTAKEEEGIVTAKEEEKTVTSSTDSWDVDEIRKYVL